MEEGFRERLSDTKNSAIVTNLLLSGTFFESDILATGSLDSAISVLKTYRNFSQCCGSSTLRSSCSSRNPRGPTTSNAGRSLFLLRKRWSREQRGGDIFSPPILQNYISLFKCTFWPLLDPTRRWDTEPPVHRPWRRAQPPGFDGEKQFRWGQVCQQIKCGGWGQP